VTSIRLRVLYAVATLISDRGFSPTFRDICTLLDLASTNSLPTHLEWLRAAGYIDWVPRANRTIRLTVKGWSHVVGEELTSEKTRVRRSIAGVLREHGCR